MLQYLFHDHYAQNTKLIYKYTGNGRKFLLPVIGYISNIMILCCMMIAHVINWCYVHFGMIFNNSVICLLTVLVSCIHFIFYSYVYHVLALFDSIVNREKISQNLPVYVQMYYWFESNPTDYFFSSPMLKAQVNFSDCFLSSIHLSISFCLPVNYLKTFSSTSPEALSQFQANLA